MYSFRNLPRPKQSPVRGGLQLGRGHLPNHVPTQDLDDCHLRCDHLEETAGQDTMVVPVDPRRRRGHGATV